MYKGFNFRVHNGARVSGEYRSDGCHFIRIGGFFFDQRAWDEVREFLWPSQTVAAPDDLGEGVWLPPYTWRDFWSPAW